jgi:predicted outer membrane repeat protein
MNITRLFSQKYAFLHTLRFIISATKVCDTITHGVSKHRASGLEGGQKMRKALFLLAMFSLLCRTALGAVWYVDKDNSSGTEDGTSWATAFVTIQASIDAVSDDSGGEIWVAEGVYDEERAHSRGSVVMQEDVHLYGGFAGSETAREQRDWESFVTVIDGSTSRGGEAAYHVIIGADNTTLDGFTITGGNADGDGSEDTFGGGMYNFNASPTVTNCTFQGNSAAYGGGMSNELSSDPTLTDCTFENNSASGGGGMANLPDSLPVLTRCTFKNNSTPAGGGGGMMNLAASPTLTDCTFEDNSAPDGAGGGMYNEHYCWTALTRCTFQGNSAPRGGAIYNRDAWPTLTDCIFTGNTAASAGGAMYNYNYPSFSLPGPTVTDCIFTANSTDGDGGAIFNDVGQWPAISNCTFVDNTAINGGGMYTSSVSDLVDTFEGFVRNCTFSGNVAEQDGGGMYLYSPPPRGAWDYYDTEDDAITVAPTDCTFTDNQADRGGGMCVGVDAESAWLPNVARCYFRGNAARLGGGIFSERLLPHDWEPRGESMVTNCVFALNTAEEAGGGMYSLWVSPSLTNCTFSGNTATNSGGGIFNAESASPVVLNCILWGDSPEEIANLDATSDPILTFSDVQGGYPGDGNIDLDPLFVDPAAGDFRLEMASPCIDTGTSDGALETDIILIPRPQGAEVDIGAYEFTDADSDGDTIPDTYEGGYDPDGDELPNYLDTDSDGDGHTDSAEATSGSDPYDADSVPIDGRGGSCFIATAVYGTPAAREVGVLSEFRDRYLLTNRAGAAFVRTYYRFSPPVARFIAVRRPLKVAVRTCLAPVVVLVKFTPILPQILTVISLAVFLLTRKRRTNLFDNL